MGPYTYLVLNTCNWRKISCAFLLFHMIIQVYAKICRISWNAASLMPCGQLAYSGLYPTQRHYISIPGNFWLGKNFDFLFSYQILTWKQNSLQRQCRGSNHFTFRPHDSKMSRIPRIRYSFCTGRYCDNAHGILHTLHLWNAATFKAFEQIHISLSNTL